ncbi:hypothetical protein ACTAQI_04555 [Pseudarthrobacter sp. alpha12b]
MIAHVAARGRALVQLIDWAADGEERVLYAPAEARADTISALAAMPREELAGELRASAMHFAEEAERLAGTLIAPEVQVNGRPLQATSIVALQIAEVVVRHQDLDTAWTIEEADPYSLLDALEAAVRSLGAKNVPGMTLVTEERDQWTAHCALSPIARACSSGWRAAMRRRSRRRARCGTAEVVSLWRRGGEESPPVGDRRAFTGDTTGSSF